MSTDDSFSHIACVDLLNNANIQLQTPDETEHCGHGTEDCDNACDDAPNNATNKCFAGTRPGCHGANCCGYVCNAGYTSCGNDCLGLLGDPGNCGSCGNACSDGQTCSNGACVAPASGSCAAGSGVGGGGQCTPCAGGTFSPGGRSSCTPCGAGTFATGARNRSCSPCPPGSYCPFPGTATPTPCPAGTFASTSGRNQCIACPVGTTSRSGAPSCESGVSLCTDPNFGGTCDIFTTDVPDLGRTRVGNDKASSVRIAHGRVAALFKDINFHGTCAIISGSVSDLGTTAVGNDMASSLRVDTQCPPPCGPPIRPCNKEVASAFLLIGLAGKCLNVEGYGDFYPNGTFVTLYACMHGLGSPDPLPTQLWTYQRSGTNELRSQDGKCLDVMGASQNGSRVGLFDCSGNSSQRWTFQRDGSIRSASGKCLDVAGGSAEDGTRAILWDCTGGANQKWSIKYVRP